MAVLLDYGKYYHIFNRGNNKEILFREDIDYLHFLSLYRTYIQPVTETISWCLMNNHFHFCVQIKERQEIGFLNPDDVFMKNNPIKWKYNHDQKNKKCFKPSPARQFAHLFNAYSKWYNFKYERTGSLFEKNYERKLISDESYLSELVIYINNNPVKHRIKSAAEKYFWSSANGIIDNNDRFCNLTLLMKYLGDTDNFKFLLKKRNSQTGNWKDIEE